MGFEMSINIQCLQKLQNQKKFILNRNVLIPWATVMDLKESLHLVISLHFRGEYTFYKWTFIVYMEINNFYTCTTFHLLVWNFTYLCAYFVRTNVRYSDSDWIFSNGTYNLVFFNKHNFAKVNIRTNERLLYFFRTLQSQNKRISYFYNTMLIYSRWSESCSVSETI